jgi:hypothetical protein
MNRRFFKSIFSACLCLFFITEVLGQTISRQLISSFGDVRRSGDFHLSYSIGEAASFTSAAGGTAWRIGFQQGYDGIPNSTENVANKKIQWQLFPNPVSWGQSITVGIKSPAVAIPARNLIITQSSGIIHLAVEKPEFPLTLNIPATMRPGLHWITLTLENGEFSSHPFILY